ncbi:MAG: BrnT family toxin [Pseudomonadota bacterium]|nr:BrnT family toxin [Pseudomonadota bacterium]
MTWDEPKRLANLDAHGLDFSDVERFDWSNALIRESYRGKHGERRFQAIGSLVGRLVSVIFAPLGTEAIAVISLRAASPKERKLHADRQA